jgi:hypothetical protein
MIRALRLAILRRRAMRLASEAAAYMAMPAGQAWHCGIAVALQRRADLAAVAYHRAIVS